MDLVSHFITGAAIGEFTLRKHIGKRALWAGGLVSLLPDSDVLANLFYDPFTAAYFHRGITHSFLFAILASPVIALLPWRLFRARENRFLQTAHFYFLVLLSHIALDLFTCYGTGVFEPFSHKRYSTNTIFVVDPFYTLPLLISFCILIIRKKDDQLRKTVNLLGSGLAAAYLLFTFMNKYQVNKVIKSNLAEQQLSYEKMMTTPAPLNNFLWFSIVKSRQGFYTTYYSIFDNPKKVEFDYVPRNELILTLFQDNDLIPVMQRFSKGYYCFTKKGRQVYFNDMRFGRASGWAVKDSRWVFSYNVTNKADGLEILNRSDLEISYREALNSLIKRAAGHSSAEKP